ncbi:bifunctional diguanylate cyclase/phosphodiesterase [Mycobacterium sp. 1274761.0]|uniref:putative bifunctional diguanylate cyclase/phosphodiesterase n=1 Tax=Mycobacterium sp. 1274761.0 TaxID=1834077 RepID=UPI001E4A7C6A|nr:EAL domain-containing protein [Mycobacterium sp. 1274761.0]
MTGSQLRSGLFAGVLVVFCINASAPWGHTIATRIDAALQLTVCVGSILCGLVVAARASGSGRLWRLLVVGGLTAWLIAFASYWTARGVTGTGAAPAVSVAAFFLPPIFGAAASVVLLGAGVGSIARRDARLRYSRGVTVLDGLVATIAFSIMVFLGGFNVVEGGSLPRASSSTVVVAYTIIELVVVVASALVAMVYPPESPYRATFLLLAGGVIMLASSDRILAYLQTVGVEHGRLWGGIGFVMGPLMLGLAMAEHPHQPPKRARELIDWAQLVLPYVGFLGITVLLAFHVLIGQPLTAVPVTMTLLMVVLVASRQVVAVRSHRQLMNRLMEAQSRLAHQVHHDALTGLPNRVLFAERLDEAIRRGPFVLIFVDLDDFKEVNDRFGHAGGDNLLRAVGERLARCIGEADTLARIGGDEFAILIDGEQEPPEVVADRIRVALRDPFAVHGSSIRVRASMGLVRPNGEPAPSSDDLLRQADVSMYAGKRVGKDTAVVYRPSLGVSTDFPTALRQAKGGVPEGFSLAYQPVVRLPDATPVAVEALARWTAPNGADIQPDAFVAAAEAAGLGAALDSMVLNMACSELSSVGADLTVHVNIGAARLGSLEFERRVLQTLNGCGLTPDQLVLEITETVPIVDLPDAAAQIRRFNAMGVRVALDDFGAGYSSLTYLHALPVQIIKLDRGLAVGPEPNRIMTLYRSVIRLCTELGMGVIAEGIESTAQAETVFAAGCRLAQGHLFGRAAPITDFVRPGGTLPRAGVAAHEHADD